MKKHLSLNIESEVYQQVKHNVPAGQISNFVNNLLKEHLKKKKEQELAKAYQRTAQSAKMQEENKIWEGSVEDGIDDE